MKCFPILLLCFCVLGLVTLAVSQSEEENNDVNNAISEFGRRIITNVRGLSRRRSIMTESPIIALALQNIKEPGDQMALEQQYYIEPVTPTTSTVKPTFRRRKTHRPITHQKKKEGESENNNYNNDGSNTNQEPYNPFKQVVNTSFSKRRPSTASTGGRTRTRAQTNDISSTTEGQESKSKLRFTVSQEIDHDNIANNPSAFGLRGQAFRGEDGDEKPRFRPSQTGKSPFRPNRQSTTTRRTFGNGNAQSEKSPLEITYENETSTNQNAAGKRKFILRPRQQHGNVRGSGFTPATTAETPVRAQRKRKRPSFLQDSENLESKSPVVIAAPENIPRARSIDGGFRRRKTTSFTPPTQRFSASEIVINSELLPSPSPFILVSVSPLHSENRNQLRRQNTKPVGLRSSSIDYEFLKTTTGFTTDSSATISTFPTTVVTDIENVLIPDSAEQSIILPPAPSSTVRPVRPNPIKHQPGRNRGVNERLQIRGRTAVDPTPGVPAAIQASASTTVQVVSPSPQSPAEGAQPGQEGVKPLFPTRMSLFDKLNRKQATLRLLSPKPRADKPVEQVNAVEIKSSPPRKITSLTQQNLRKRIPGSKAGVLNRKLQKEIASDTPPQEGENVSSEVSEEASDKSANIPEVKAIAVSPSPVLGIRNLTNRRRPLTMKHSLGSPANNPVSKEKGNETQSNDQEAPGNQNASAEGDAQNQNSEAPVAPLLSKVRKLPTRAPLLHRLVITTAAPAPPSEDTATVTCDSNQRYSKFLKRCVTQYIPSKTLGLH